MDLRNIDPVTREALDHFVFPLVSKTDVNAGDPVIFKSGKGMMMTDIMGKSYLDMLSTNTRASSLGFANEHIAKAIYDQLMELHYAGTFAQTGITFFKLPFGGTAFSDGSGKTVIAGRKVHNQQCYDYGYNTYTNQQFGIVITTIT